MKTSQPRHSVRCLYDVKVPARDGTRLSADVYLPDIRGPLPTILLRTPYDSTRAPHIDWAVWWARRGYAAVVQDNRGKFKSEGEFYAYRDDGRDGDDSLYWIADQPWSNGRIGMSGRSYGGLVQWQLAPFRNPNLTAMAPQVIAGDFFGEIHRIGGAIQWGLTVMAAILYSTNHSFSQRGSMHLFGNQEFYRHLPLIDADVAAIGRPIPFFRDWLERSVYDEYWRALNVHDRLSEIDVPIYQQGGWYDPYAEAMFGLFNGMRDRGYSEHARRSQKIYIGPWAHHIPDGSQLGDLDFGPAAYVDLNVQDLRWYDHWLKDIDTGVMDEPPINIFVMGRNEWRHEHEWPLARTRFVRYFLHSTGRANTLNGDGTLDQDIPTSEPPDHFTYDPEDPVPTVGGNNSTWTWMQFATDKVLPGPVDQRGVEKREDVLVYTSSPLERDLEVTGPLEVVLYAASSALDTDFTAKLVDVHPTGVAFHISEGILRARYRDGFEQTTLLDPGEVYQYRIDLASTSNVFKKGHQIRVEISSSNFPRFDRNLNTGESIHTGTRMVVAEQTVLHTAIYPSHIVLPVIPS